MNKLFILGAALFLLGTSVIGCSNTAQGLKQDTANNAQAAKEATDRAALATEKAAHNAAVQANKAAENAASATEKAAASASQAAKETGSNVEDATTLTPKVKLAITSDSELNNTKNLINVDTANDVVHLKGHVMTNRMKQRAGTIAEKTVKASHSSDTVSNELKVTGQ
jgi:osmotically-inducible protein OsmY